MLRSVKEIIGYNIKATDGEIGKVDDFFLDDLDWTVRYIVVDTGNWLPGRRVLISPVEVREPDWKNQTLPVWVTREKIESGPGVESDVPVSRQHEAALASHFGWPYYWGPIGLGGGGITAASAPRRDAGNDDPHLRSVNEMMGYGIQALDEKVGHVEDFIATTRPWLSSIFYMVVDTRNWLPGKKALVLPAAIERVDWQERLVHINLTGQQIKDGKEFDPKTPVNIETATQIYDYEGRPIITL